MIKSLLPAVIFLCASHLSYAQPGKLDPTFGNNGIVTTDMGSPFKYSSSARQVIPRPDGSIYIILDATIITKRLADGSLDLSYGFNGYSRLLFVTDAFAAIQADGKIIIAGSIGNGLFGITRINSNGLPDSAFGTNGLQTLGINPRSLAVQSDGKIVVAGYFTDDVDDTYFSVVRYTIDGHPDNTFNENGQVITDFGFKIPPDTEEGDSVDIYRAFANSVAIQADGKIVVGGYAYTGIDNDFAIVRYTMDGRPDSTFNNDGRQSTGISAGDDVGNSIVIQSDGKIVLGGYTTGETANRFSVVRYNTNGSLDSSFSGDGKQTADLGSDATIGNSVSIQSDDKIIVAGYTLNSPENNDFAVARFNTNGSPDNSFATDGELTTDFNNSDDYAGFVTLQDDGKIIVAGYSFIYEPNRTLQNFALARYNTNGTLDNSFDTDGKLEGDYKQGYTEYNAIAIQADGKLVVAGQAWNGSNYSFALARYNNNGSADSTFNGDGKQITGFTGNSYATSLAVQSDGKIVVAGNSNNQFIVARYNSDGTPDNTFSAEGRQTVSMGFSDICRSVALQSDGKIVLAGFTFTDFNYNSAYFAIARLNANGTPDNTFSQDGKQLTDFGSLDFANSVAVQNDGKIVVAGRSYIDNNNQFSLARYSSDGSLDTTFSNDGKQNNLFGPDSYFIQSLAIQNDGNIVVAGYSETPEGSSSAFLVARYKTNGELDTTFSDDGFKATALGRQFEYGKCIAINADGRIAVGGTNDNLAVVIYNGNGSLDTTFSGDGIQVTNPGIGKSSIQSLAFADNKLYAAGSGEFPGTLGVVVRYLLEGNEAPAVLIKTPSNKAIYIAPANIAIEATATDSDGNITGVAFYNGATLLHTDSISPYRYILDSLPEGEYSFVAKATDNSGLITSSASVGIVVTNTSNKAPLVKIISPGNNRAYVAPATIIVHAAVSDSDGTVSNVKFFKGETLVKTDSTAPYSYTLSKAAAGIYSFMAKATDNKGLISTSASVSVGVSVTTNKAPVVKITSPGKNVVYTLPASITLNAAASDADGTITSVKFYNNGMLLKTDSTSPYSHKVDNLETGNCSFTATATDNEGLSTSSASVTVLVAAGKNNAPLVSIINPVNGANFTGPATINIEALAQDRDGSIHKVDFYNGTTLLVTERKMPYTYKWQNVVAGNYAITAVATDNLGRKTTSAPIAVTIAPPAAPLVNNRPSMVNDKTDFEGDVTLQLAPNPVNNILTIYNAGMKNKQITISIIAASGVIKKTMRSIHLSQTIQLNVSSLLTGVYTLKIISGDNVVYKQFVKL